MKSALTTIVSGCAALTLSGCASGPAPVHQAAQLNGVAASCGLEPGALVQSQDASRLLIIDRPDATRSQRQCVEAWARANGMRSLLVNLQFEDNGNESERMIALVAAASSAFVLTRVDPTYLPAININGRVHRVLAVTITGKPDLIPPLKAKLGDEGWKILPASDAHLALVSPAGHSLDEVTGLSFRVTNGEFGNLKFNVTMEPAGKTDFVVQSRTDR